jgi:endonuclease/exonuclease/phosphatase (EEP) superfamily protein YafD
MNEPQPLTDEQWCDFHAWARLSDRCIATCGDDEITLGMLVATIDRQQRELEAARLFSARLDYVYGNHVMSCEEKLDAICMAHGDYEAMRKENADA